MAYRIWQTDRRSAAYRADSGNLMPVLRILVESAALQFVVEVILLILYSINYNAQYILLEIVTPLVVRSPNPFIAGFFFLIYILSVLFPFRRASLSPPLPFVSPCVCPVHWTLLGKRRHIWVQVLVQPSIKLLPSGLCP